MIGQKEMELARTGCLDRCKRGGEARKNPPFAQNFHRRPNGYPGCPIVGVSDRELCLVSGLTPRVACHHEAFGSKGALGCAERRSSQPSHIISAFGGEPHGPVLANGKEKGMGAQRDRPQQKLAGFGAEQAQKVSFAISEPNFARGREREGEGLLPSGNGPKDDIPGVRIEPAQGRVPDIGEPYFFPLSGPLGTVGDLLGVLPCGSFLDHGAPTSPPQNFHGRCTAAPQVPRRIKPRR